MKDLISIIFGTPEHGWLPVDFQWNDFRLSFEASDALNDPIDELHKTVTEIQNNERRRITWWLEPAAYFFDIERIEGKYSLTIIDTVNLQDESADKTVLIAIAGNHERIIEPFRIALNQFLAASFEEIHWPHTVD